MDKSQIETRKTGMHPSHFNEPGRGKISTTLDKYTREMADATERYNVEGLVALYENQPDYPDSGFERDHQPHNDIIETMAMLPEFAGKKMQNVAAGRTLKGWSILLHHKRHSLGRTYGNKGGIVTAQFSTDLAAERIRLAATGGATATAIRQYCIDYLVQSMKDDVLAMKTVANDTANSYPEINDLSLSATDKTNIKNKIKDNIIAGEDRILHTETYIRDYDK